MSENVTEIEQDHFEAIVTDNKFTIVDFYSTECPPCEALAPKFGGIAEIFGQKIRFVKIFRQGNRELSEKLEVRGSPTLLFFKDGKEVGKRLSGGIHKINILEQIAELIGRESTNESMKGIPAIESEVEILILGAGPAGLTAGIYAGQAKRDVLVIDPALAGGQVSTTHQVSNYPGFVEPQPGFMLSHYMSEQAKAAGARFKEAVDITSVDLEKKEVVIDGNETIRAKKIILATGSSPRFLEVPGEKKYKGQGISYCATCDAKYFEDKEVIVIGGGNSAIEEALFISKFASKVLIVHQFDELQANKEAQERAHANPKIEFLLSHEPRAFIKTERGMDVEVEDLKSGEEKILSADGAFVFVGMKPNLEELRGELDMDDWGYVKTDALMHTNIAGVFAVGDVASKPFRQITVAVAEGTVAAIQAAKELG